MADGARGSCARRLGAALLAQLLWIVATPYFAPEHFSSVQSTALKIGRSSNSLASATLHSTGPSSASVDIVLLSEAYTSASQFFQDSRVAFREHFSAEEAPFRGLLGILNVHALFVRSNSSSIESHGPSDNPRTAFGTYRENGELRGIYASDFAAAKARRFCVERLGCDACDFLVLLVNEPKYGGLAADGVTIITNSRTSGAISARHELAHALADFGEEYDGGADYSGDNFGASLRLCREGETARQVLNRRIWQCIPWAKWLPRSGHAPSTNREAHAALTPLPSDTSERTKADTPTQHWINKTAGSSALLLAAHPWAQLHGASRRSAVAFPFQIRASSSVHAWAQLRLTFSVAGVSSASDVEIRVDGQRVEWAAAQHVDRQFHTHWLPRGQSLSLDSVHNLTFTAGPEAAATLCHFMVHAFAEGFGVSESADGSSRADETAQNSAVASDAIGAFPVHDGDGAVIGYRPTQDACLMRDMTSRSLCRVCREALWRNLFLSDGARNARISLLHTVSLRLPVATDGMAAMARTNDNLAVVEATVAPVGESGDDVRQRSSLVVTMEELPASGSWRNESHVAQSGQRLQRVEKGVVRAELAVSELYGKCWRIKAVYRTPQVRSFEVSSEARFCAPAHAAPPPGKSSPRALSPAGTDSFRCVGPEEASRERSVRYDCPLENGRMHAAAQRQFTPHAGEEPSLLGSLLVVQGCATPLLVYS